MICKLCNIDKKLINAHIIPKWAYMPLYRDDKTKSKPLIIVGADKYTKQRPIGIYDANILCKDCDTLIGKCDALGKDFFIDREIENGLLLEQIDKPCVDMLRIFILSVVWRASISNQEGFESISLGPYETKIKNILKEYFFNGKTLEGLGDFTVVVTRYSSARNKKLFDKIMQTPYLCRVHDGINVICLFLPNNFKIYIKVDKRLFSNDILIFDIDAQVGFVPILPLGNIEESDDYKALIHAVNNTKNIKLIRN